MYFSRVPMTVMHLPRLPGLALRLSASRVALYELLVESCTAMHFV